MTISAWSIAVRSVAAAAGASLPSAIARRSRQMNKHCRNEHRDQRDNRRSAATAAVHARRSQFTAAIRPSPFGSVVRAERRDRQALFGERQLRAADRVALGSEQLALAIEPAGIAAKRSVAADHPMARDQHRDVVVAVGRADRADRLGLADRGRDLGIAAGLAGRDLAELAPDRLLERGPGNVDREVGRRQRPSRSPRARLRPAREGRRRP